MRRNWAEILALALLAAVLFSVNIGGYDLWPSDEPRFGEVAREMIESGDYLVPRVNGLPYKEKPPLLFWAIAVASAPFGDVTELSARAPSVLAGVVTVLMTYLLAARLYDRRIAWWSAVVLMTNVRFWWQARTVQTDMLLTACLTLALLAFWNWHEERRVPWLITFYAAIAAGVYAKGPPAFVFPLLLVVTFYWKRKEERRKLHPLWGVAAVAGLIALWLIPARLAPSARAVPGAGADIASVVFRQIIGRMFLGVSKAQWPWYYLTTLPVDGLPWSLFLPWVVPWVWRRRREGPEMRLLLRWTVPAFIFFSACVGKRAIYLLPIFPAFAILIARSLLDLMDSGRAAWRKRTAVVWAVLLLALGCGPFLVCLTEYHGAWRNGLLLFVVPAIGFGALTLLRAFKTESRSLNAFMAVHFAVLATLCALLVLPTVNPFKSARWFCEPVRRLAQAGEEFRLYSVGFSREEYIFYAKHFHEPVLTELLPLDTPAEMDLRAMAKLQKRLREAIAEAVQAVGIDSFENVREEEITALRAAVDRSLATAAVDAALARAFEQALVDATQELVAAFDAPTPAFMFVQEADWRWLLPLQPNLRNHPVIRRGSVGRRDVLLVANDAGAELVDRAFANADKNALGMRSKTAATLGNQLRKSGINLMGSLV